jgi:hypothetical protein
MISESLAEIVESACEMSSKEEKVEFLKSKKSKPLCNILKVMYDKKMELNIPDVAPPYTPSDINESHGMLFREARKLTYFVKGFDGDGLSQARRESIFIQMLETVDRKDAQLLVKMLAQKPLKGLPLSVIKEAFPNLIEG